MTWLLALFTAALLILTFPGFGFSWLAPVALAPLLIALILERRPRNRFLLGWAAGIVYWFAVCNWIQFVLEFHGAMGMAGSWFAFLLFCLAKALHLGVFALLAGWVFRGWYGPVAVAALWVAIERTHGPLGFAWLTLGDAGIDMALPLRIAPFTGVYGLSFIFALLGAIVAAAVLRKRRHVLWLALLVPLYLFPKIDPPPAGDQLAILLQPNVKIDPAHRWSGMEAIQLKRDLLNASTRAALHNAKSPASLIVWPELPAPVYYYEDPTLRRALEALGRATGASVILGTVAYTSDGEPLNSAVHLSSSGSVVARYDKNLLVPFGEFVPPFFGWISRISQEGGDFVPGKELGVVRLNGHPVGTFICYEAVFPQFIRRTAAAGAEVLVNISNDGYFGDSAARYQHFQMVRMRAVENARWLLRSTNDGVTAIIDPAGRVRARLPERQTMAQRGRFAYNQYQTIYTRFGDWFVWLCATIALAALAATLAEARASRPPAGPRRDQPIEA